MRYFIPMMVGLLLLSPAAAQAQSDYYGGSGYGYYGGGYGYSSTVEEGYGRGVADVVRSQGIYNQLNSEAAVNFEEARRRYIENYKQAVGVYFEVRDQNKARRTAEHAERRYKTLKWLQNRKPAPGSRLSESQLDTTTGKITWHPVLMDDSFARQRRILEKLYAKRAQQGGLYAIDDRKAVETATNELHRILRERIDDIHLRDFVLARRFIKAVGHEVFYSTL